MTARTKSSPARRGQKTPTPPASGPRTDNRVADAGRAQPYDPDLGAVEVKPFDGGDRWKKAENRGMWLAYPEDGADHYHEVWMLVLKGRVRMVARGGVQHGPEHPSVVAAVYWAFGHGWRDPDISVERNVACIVEVRSSMRLLADGRTAVRVAA